MQNYKKNSIHHVKKQMFNIVKNPIQQQVKPLAILSVTTSKTTKNINLKITKPS